MHRLNLLKRILLRVVELELEDVDNVFRIDDRIDTAHVCFYFCLDSQADWREDSVTDGADLPKWPATKVGMSLEKWAV